MSISLFKSVFKNQYRSGAEKYFTILNSLIKVSIQTFSKQIVFRNCLRNFIQQLLILLLSGFFCLLRVHFYIYVCTSFQLNRYLLTFYAPQCRIHTSIFCFSLLFLLYRITYGSLFVLYFPLYLFYKRCHYNLPTSLFVYLCYVIYSFLFLTFCSSFLYLYLQSFFSILIP